MSYEYSMGMGVTFGGMKIPKHIQEALIQKTQEKVAEKRALEQSFVPEMEEAGENAAQEAIEEAAETAEVEAENGEEFFVDEELEETESFIDKIPVWGWAAIGGSVLVLGIGIVAVVRK